MERGAKLGVLIAGARGAIGSTVQAALDLMVRSGRPRLGMLCERVDGGGPSLAARLGAPALEELAVSGWDAVPRTLDDALREHRVLTEVDIQAVSSGLLASLPLAAPAAMGEEDRGGFGPAIAALRRDIDRFRRRAGVERIVLVSCLPTAEPPTFSPLHRDPALFRAACAAGDPAVTPSMRYACAAALEGAAFVNFTPNPAVVPGLAEIALERRVPWAGRDGKTGQTLLKTTLAPMLALRSLRVSGWYSVNILGNRDGQALRDPAAGQVKVRSKQECLQSILGYPVDDHQVHIHFYKPRQDNKEAWDNIDFEGLLGYPMQLKLNLLARDSILAAPLILDLCRLLAVSLQHGESGPLPHLALFFKTPEMPHGRPAVHDLFLQRQLFDEWVARRELRE